jgi:hypothetical protein
MRQPSSQFFEARYFRNVSVTRGTVVGVLGASRLRVGQRLVYAGNWCSARL